MLVPVRDDPSIFRSIRSIERMRYPNFTTVIVDDSHDPAFSKRLQTLERGRTKVIRRLEHVGRKSGALNFALDRIRRLRPAFVVVFDADHRPPRDFLARAVAAIEQTGAHCVCGYQKHDIGAHDLLGRLYQACHAAGLMNFQGRNQMGMPTIFGGGCGIFDYRWLRRKRFDETSITEDRELSCRAYVEGGFRIVIRNDLYARAEVPDGFWWFFRQHLRWAEGTTSDLRKHLPEILRSRRLSGGEKVALLYQGLYYAQAVPIVASFPLTRLGALPLPLAVTGPILLYFGASWAVTIARGAQMEGYPVRETAKVMLLGYLGYLLSYVMAPLYTYAVARGAITRRQHWVVTRRRG